MPTQPLPEFLPTGIRGTGDTMIPRAFMAYPYIIQTNIRARIPRMGRGVCALTAHPIPIPQYKPLPPSANKKTITSISKSIFALPDRLAFGTCYFDLDPTIRL